ncbi:TfdA family taurine catabolism dioxygenase TauD [Sulfuritortus calidifontis]|uniref:TfdA family taurine catabolism dioxygenase TauD n=1 Tax=Sulfuritortus calidifontis TaxID=1914471 RepID=A0A4R3JYJ9_9PROT|nr:TauD/TfdA family dioxygenase [Sulfuritortus calidifontis]TCS73860.1 TfdA family taurine catabolism dioxygenase TauD [Sulfuritortus calidifontis]
MIPLDSPFHPDNEAGYQAWRSAKLAGYPSRGEELIVPVKDPTKLTAAEYEAIWRLCQKTNMAIYATDLGEAEDKESIRRLAAQFGLEHLDANWLADEDGISSLTPQDEEGKARGEYIPYTHHRIRWHTDGYYNPPERRIFAMTLHCVREADEGGENDLMDHELAYLYLRDANPEHIRALMAEDAMTIPARTDEMGVARPDEMGPALLVDNGQLHLRYTARTKSIAWKQDARTLAAVKALEDLLADRPAGVFTLKLKPGMGLLCNNVLHTRSGFTDRPEHRRLLYRARYHDHIRNLRQQ